MRLKRKSAEIKGPSGCGRLRPIAVHNPASALPPRSPRQVIRCPRFSAPRAGNIRRERHREPALRSVAQSKSSRHIQSSSPASGSSGIIFLSLVWSSWCHFTETYHARSAWHPTHWLLCVRRSPFSSSWNGQMRPWYRFKPARFASLHLMVLGHFVGSTSVSSSLSSCVVISYSSSC